MKPLTPEDPEYFTTYSNKPYDRHQYKIVYKDGRKVVVDDYDQMKAIWFHSRDIVETVEIIDPHKKKKGGGGF